MSTTARADVGTRLPTYFISHGGGPWPWIKDQMPGDWTPLEDSLTAIPRELGVAPRAILAVSGHWEAPELTVQTHPHPPMYYDYSGFPDFTYRVQYPAPGSPEVAALVRELLEGAGIPVREDAERGFDHGVFAPFVVAYPDADVPILQLSIKHGYDPGEHLAAGRALAPLRDEGVLIVGSGFFTHNLSGMRPDADGAAPGWSAEFDRWGAEALAARDFDALLDFEHASPAARLAHPRTEHFAPLFVSLGASTGTADTPRQVIDGYWHGLAKRSVQFD